MPPAETTLAETAELLRSLRGVWDEVAVDEFDHATQSAARAIDDGADDELVLAAALHDIGHSPHLGGPAHPQHEAIARDWLTIRFGDRVGWLAGAHVAAKRHLVATEADYGQGLSSTSVTSLGAQGGARTDAAFADSPWWPDALRLRRYDDAAKVPGADGATVEEILAIARRVMLTREAR